jgi:hypothetical protein
MSHHPLSASERRLGSLLLRRAHTKLNPRQRKLFLSAPFSPTAAKEAINWWVPKVGSVYQTRPFQLISLTVK